MATTYHHGELPDALRSATVQLVAEKGPTGFSLREVARRAGVSHAAPKHHFGDAQGLLTSVAIEGFNTLADAFVAATEGIEDAAERLAACGRAYVTTARANRGHLEVMMEDDLLDQTNLELLAAGARAYDLLTNTVEAVRDQLNPDLDVEMAAPLCWAAMHGLVDLAPKLTRMAEDHATPDGPLEDIVDRFTDMLLNGFLAR